MAEGARRWRARLAVGLLALLGGCSLFSVAYNNALTLAVWGGNRYFSLTSAQEADLRSRLEPLLAWHRATQLPDYAGLLVQVQQRIRGPVTAADVAWLYAESRRRFQAVVDATAPDAAVLALTLKPEQIDRLGRRFADNDREYLKSDVDVPPEDPRERFIRDSLKSVERWLGPLEDSQRQSLRNAAAAIPFSPPLIHEDIVRRHRDLIQLLRLGIAGGPDVQRQVEAGLKRILGRWQEGQSAAYGEYIGGQTSAFHQFFAEAMNQATGAQREHALERLQFYIDECRALAAQPQARAAPERQAAAAAR